MAKYKHYRKPEKRIRKRKVKEKNPRRIFLGLIALFIVFVAGATVYSVTTFYSAYPKVTLTSIVPKYIEELDEDSGTALPKKCMYYESEHVYAFYVVEQTDGPWGNQYRLKKETSFIWDEQFESCKSYVPVLIVNATIDKPIAVPVDENEFLYAGMLVSILG